VCQLSSAAREPSWSLPDNLDQVQRGSLALLRREVLTCSPQHFADFLLRWQYVHPEKTRTGESGLTETLERLQNFTAPAELWEQVILPQRSPDFQTRWLDNALTGGEWSWACQGAGDEGPGDLAFLRREQFLELLPPRPPETQLDEPAENVLALLRQRGASFVTELAQPTGLPPTTIRAALGRCCVVAWSPTIFSTSFGAARPVRRFRRWSRKTLRASCVLTLVSRHAEASAIRNAPKADGF